MIELQKLTKYYGKARGIDGIDLKVAAGEVFGFLGPNGSGKTTTIRILVDMIRPSSGHALIGGLDCQQDTMKVRAKLEYLPGDFVPYPFLTGREYLEFMAGFYSRRDHRADELAERLELDLTRKVRDYSRGMKQKLGVIQTFMTDCELYVLDEPTIGLDPLMQQRFYELVREAKQAGRTVFLSSHILPEVEHICDRVAIIREGKLVEVNRVDALTSRKFKRVRVVYAEPVPAGFLEQPGIEVVTAKDREFELKLVARIGANLHHLTSRLVQDMTVTDPTLEDVFLSYYGNEKAQHPEPK
jgi:ABC-2 type transport system ATP-binding protein